MVTEMEFCIEDVMNLEIYKPLVRNIEVRYKIDEDSHLDIFGFIENRARNG